MIIADARFRPWLESRLGMTLAADAQFIGRIENGQITVAAAFSHYTGHDIELSVAGEPGSGSRAYLRAVFGYVFDQCGCARCTVKTRESNSAAIRLAERLGFQREGLLRNGFGDEAAILFGLTRNDYGERRRKPTPGT